MKKSVAPSTNTSHTGRHTWNPVGTKKPHCPRDPNALGTPVLVYTKGLAFDGRRVFEAYYGKRATGSYATFYLHGAVLENVTHWMPMPKGPA